MFHVFEFLISRKFSQENYNNGTGTLPVDLMGTAYKSLAAEKPLLSDHLHGKLMLHSFAHLCQQCQICDPKGSNHLIHFKSIMTTPT